VGGVPLLAGDGRHRGDRQRQRVDAGVPGAFEEVAFVQRFGHGGLGEVVGHDSVYS